MALDPERYYAQLEASTAVIAGLAGGGLTRPVPTCPGWTLRDLAGHVGLGQRWATQILRTRPDELIPFSEVPDGQLPADPAAHAPWLASGVEQLIAALQDAGEDRVWVFGHRLPAAFWARRICHDTLVHAADAALAAGQRPEIAPEVAADAIDEWLTVLTLPEGSEPDRREAALPPGSSLHVHVTGEGLAGAGEWLLRHERDGVRVDRAHGKGDVAVTGPAGPLLLVLMRRLPADDPALTVHGDAAVLTRWLAQSAF